MINLIPPAAKKRIIMEYWVRTISLWGFLGGSALLLVASLFIPLNIYVINQETYLATLLKNNEVEQNSHQQNNALLLQANQKALYLLQTQNEYALHHLLPVLQEVASEMAVLEEVTLRQMNEPILTIGGVAQTRQSLVGLRDELEKYENFLMVDLPIGNLIKESEVPFTITITLATSTIAL